MLSLSMLKIVAWLSAWFDAGLGVGVFFWRRRAGRSGQPVMIGLGTLAVAVGATLAGFFLTAIVLLATHRISGFGLIRLAYFNGAIVPTVLGLVLLAASLRNNPVRIPISTRIGAALMLLPLPVCLYASFVEPYDLRLEKADVPVAGWSGEPVRIAVLADLQTDRITDYERDAVERALAERPDVIVLPGDFFQGTIAQYREQLPHFRELFKRLDAPGGVFACQGNIDSRYRMNELFTDTPVQLLYNDVATVNVRGHTLAIGGIEWRYNSLAAKQAIASLAQSDADARILLGHTPDVAAMIRTQDRVELVISGHTHGGQVVIPGFGPLVTASSLPRCIGGGGLHRAGEQPVYVSRGVGFERSSAPPVRLFCPPEVSLLTLTSDKTHLLTSP